MRFNDLKTCLKTAVLLTAVLLLGAGLAVAQQQVNLTAGPATATLPDGTTVPMWGYSCDATQPAGSLATCATPHPNVPVGAWSPVVITVPTGQILQINLTNSLSFTPAGTTTANNIPTSLVIVGQLGAGLGTSATSAASPDHTYAQGCVTWPIADAPPGQPCNAATASNTVPPPSQGPRVQSFSTEVASGATPTALTFGTTTNPLRPGTYLLESGTHPSIQGPMGLYGMVVVTTAPAGTTAGTAYPAVGTTPAVTYNAEADLLFSEIDPVQNNAVQAAVTTAGFSETMVWSGQPGGCGNPSSTTYHQCYPPAVNYTPLYYLINGVGFSKSNASASLFAATPGTAAAPVSGSVLVRMVNAGLRMHVPSIVGSQTGTAVAPALPPSGFALIAEDGNPLPGIPRVQSEVFMAAGKTYDVMVNVPAAGASALPVYDRELSLSGNATARDAGMIAYIGVNGSALPSAGAFGAAVARADTYNSLVAGQTLTVSDPGKGVIANDTNVYGVQVDAATAVTGGTVTLNANGTFTFVPTGTSGSFGYCANGTTQASLAPVCTTVTLGAATLEAATGITCSASSYASNVATTLSIKPPGILAACKDGAGYPLTVNAASVTPASGLTLSVDANGGFNASVSSAGTYTFTYKAQNSQGVISSGLATATVVFPAASNLAVTVLDGADKTTVISDYRWIIEEDRTFYIDPNCTTKPLPATCTPFGSTGIVPTFGTNFHTSYMPVVASGCTGALSCEGGQTMYDSRPACTAPGVPTGCSTTAGQHIPAVCDVGNGICRPDPTGTTPGTGNGFTAVLPGSVHLDPMKRYFISVLPGDAANPFAAAYGGPPCGQPGADPTSCVTGHGMGGAPIAAACTPVPPATTCTGTFAPITVLSQPTPFPPAKLSVFVFEDDFPLNGEQDGGGGGTTVSRNNEPGLGGFEIILFDDAGGTGDATGQLTHDMFNQPLSNSLAGTIDPLTGNDACPIVTTNNPMAGMDSSNGNSPTGAGAVGTLGITGRIVTCPRLESDNKTDSPLAGQAVIPNMMQGRYGVVATPGADRIARGEEWLQTNTLDGQKAHDSFLRIAEPGYFQEFGPAGFHVSIGFANPAIINARKAGVCNGTDPTITGLNCTHTVRGVVTTERMSRTPDQRLYSSGDNSSFGFTQCYVSFGDPDGEDFAFTKCNSDGSFTLTGLPDGDWRLTVFDQWNDMLVDGLSTPVGLGSGFTCSGADCNLGQIATNQWQANISTATFFDTNGNGVRDANEAGLTLVSTNIRFRDGSFSNFNNTDLSGNAGFNEVFPLFSWYVVETDSTRYKSTGTHVVYDAGGPSDGTSGCGGTAAGAPPLCGNSTIAANMANTAEVIPVPANLRVPGAYYCSNADCTDLTGALTPGLTAGSPGGSTGRVDPPWVLSEGWQGFSGQNSFLEFGKKPFAAATGTSPAENGGIHGEVVYDSTRPFDDPQLNLHLSWTPNVPNVTVNLYQEGVAADGVTQTLKLVDTTKTSSWDDWAQGFHTDPTSASAVVPNMNCPGQGRDTGTNADLFFFSLFNQPNYLDFYNSQHGGPAITQLPANSQFKCYDGMHSWNQLQPAPYDGKYRFPSVTGINPTTGMPTGTNCTICIPNPDTTDPWRSGTPMLPAGTYVVEVVVPPGYELLKEEDKNILIGDNYIAPVTQEFGGLGAVYILPDQAAVASSYNANNAQNQTTDLGTLNLPRGEGDTGSVEQFWRCVGAARIVPDYMSIFPQAQEVAAFAGATRNLCDRREVVVSDQASSLAKFYIFSSTHVASHFTGVITDDFTSEFDPFSPQFGEKFSPPNLPVSVKDWAGNEVNRVYADHWGTYDGLIYSTWEVNPPNPTGYGPNTMVVCMNDPGTGTTPDPLFTYGYSQFCYEIPFMPGQTQYMDTPVVPTAAFAGAGYNNVDCNYPDLTPAIKEVDGDGIGPWLSATGPLQLTITALGDQPVPNYGYTGPSSTTTPFSLKTVNRHYGFGARPTTCGSGSNCPNVTIGGISAVVSSWTDATIIATARAVGQIPLCTIQQQAQYGGSEARCGQLVITAGNGRQSIDAVTVTIGGKAPTHVAASASVQAAIDAAAPGDLIIVNPTCTTPGTTTQVACTTAGATHSNSSHNEILIMWKPVRLQGVGAASSILNANTHPAGKLDVWRRQVNCLFGLALNGQPYTSGTDPNISPTNTNPFDPSGASTCPGTGWQYFTNSDPNNPQVDRLPLEATTGWDLELNGNLAEMLQEPSLMGALEGAGITVLSKGVFFPTSPYDPTLLAGFPTGTILFTSANTSTYCNGSYPSNFWCNPASIDGLAITDSSQGGGGIFAHGWGHNLQIANNRIYNNAGTLSGGINIGQGEFPGAYIFGSATNASPGSCMDRVAGPGIGIINPTLVTNQQLPYCHNLNVNVHHNAVTLNSSNGDELFSATPAGAGGVTFCAGADYYKFNYNWVCGNLSTGDGGGIGHQGYSWNGDIERNSIIFNQSTNPSIPTNGGGIIVLGTPDVDPTCGIGTDQDCVPALGSVGPSDGIGPGLVINANLIQGNAAESGSGGGIAFQHLNGTDAITFPTTPAQWYSVQFTNNIVTDNVAGWDGGGISLLDALKVNIINNTIVSNDTTASSGMLFNTLGAPLAGTQGPCPPAFVDPSTGLCTVNVTTSTPQPAGLVSIQNSATLKANFPTTITCPPGHYSGTTANNGACRSISYPELYNNIFWQNRAFFISVGALGTGTLNQQHVVTLNPTLSQTVTGSCPAATNYWDIGVRLDSGSTNHGSGFTLNPVNGVLTNTSGYSSTNLATNPAVASQYCNGSRVPPEATCQSPTGQSIPCGYQVPPGIADATVPNPIFNLTPVATVDEGNNWVNMRWGPLSMTNPSVQGTDLNYGGGPALGSYVLLPASPDIDHVACTPGGGGCTETIGTNGVTSVLVPATDFFGNPRPDSGNTNHFDIGAVEFQGTGTAPAGPTLTAISPASGARGATVHVTLTGTNFTTTGTTVTVSGANIAVSGVTVVNSTTITANFVISTTAALSPPARNVTVTTPNGSATLTGAFTVTGLVITFSGPTPALTTTPATRTTKTGTITVSNVSGAPFTYTASSIARLSGTGTFSITGGTCAAGGGTIATGGTCTMTVQYVPPAAPASATSTANVTVTASTTVSFTSATFTGN